MILNVAAGQIIDFGNDFTRFYCFTIVLLFHLEISRFFRLMCPELLGSSLVQRREAQFVVCSERLGVIGS